MAGDARTAEVRLTRPDRIRAGYREPMAISLASLSVAQAMFAEGLTTTACPWSSPTTNAGLLGTLHDHVSGELTTASDHEAPLRARKALSWRPAHPG